MLYALLLRVHVIHKFALWQRFVPGAFVPQSWQFTLSVMIRPLRQTFSPWTGAGTIRTCQVSGRPLLVEAMCI